MSPPGEKVMPPGRETEGPNDHLHGGRSHSEYDTAVRPNKDDAQTYRRRMAQLDADYVRQSFQRSWDPEIRRLRRLLRGAT